MGDNNVESDEVLVHTVRVEVTAESKYLKKCSLFLTKLSVQGEL